MRKLAFPNIAPIALTIALTFGVMSPASAIPVFAHRYGFSCQVCHTVVPHLTSFGRMFLANGYRIPGVRPKGAFPIAVRVESAYASAGAADPDESSGPLPKAIVDEVEAFIGGASGSRGSYWVENYFVDGGESGHLRDAWYANRLTADGAKVPVVARIGQFTLPLPLDPETLRETTQPYLIWGQTAGSNPFSFFPAKAGIQTEIGDPGRGLAGSLNLIQGREPGSGLQPNGLDRMLSIEREYGDWTLSAYRYTGKRQLQGLGYGGTFQVSNVGDSFWRNGYGVSWNHGKNEVDAVYQIGHDSSADLYHNALMTSGGFVQVRHELNSRSFAIARWDATQDAASQRSITAGLGVRPRPNMRVTLFETQQRDYLGNLLHIISSSWLFAY